MRQFVLVVGLKTENRLLAGSVHKVDHQSEIVPDETCSETLKFLVSRIHDDCEECCAAQLQWVSADSGKWEVHYERMTRMSMNAAMML